MQVYLCGTNQSRGSVSTQLYIEDCVRLSSSVGEVVIATETESHRMKCYICLILYLQIRLGFY